MTVQIQRISSSVKRVDPQEVVNVLTREGLKRMKLSADSWRGTMLQRFGDRILPHFGRYLVDIDAEIGSDGIRAACRTALGMLNQSTHIVNPQQVPADGPVLVVTNHPGAADFVHLFAATPRDDSRVVAGTDLLDILPNGKEFFLYTSTAKRRERGETTRMLVEELVQNRCIILFPRGVIEPDPRWMPGARATVQHWRRSMVRLAEAVPNLTIVPTLVSGALSRRALEHWSVRPYFNQMLRGRGAAILQSGSATVKPENWPLTVTVEFGKPLRGVVDLFERVSAEMNQLITLSRDPAWPLTARVSGWF